MVYFTEFDKKYIGESASSDMKDDFVKIKGLLSDIAHYHGRDIPYGLGSVSVLTIDMAGFVLPISIPLSQLALTTSLSTADSDNKGYLCLSVKHFKKDLCLSQLEKIAEDFDLVPQGTRKCGE